MTTRRLLLTAPLWLGTVAVAQDAGRLVGTWRLTGFRNEFQDGSPAKGAYGERPTGFVIFTAERRFMSIVEAEGRKTPATDEERAAAFRGLIAYTGRFRIEGDKLVIAVDASWNAGWNGTEQVRFFRFVDGLLEVTSPWVMSPNLGKVTRSTATWEPAN